MGCIMICEKSYVKFLRCLLFLLSRPKLSLMLLSGPISPWPVAPKISCPPDMMLFHWVFCFVMFLRLSVPCLYLGRATDWICGNFSRGVSILYSFRIFVSSSLSVSDSWAATGMLSEDYAAPSWPSAECFWVCNTGCSLAKSKAIFFSDSYMGHR